MHNIAKGAYKTQSAGIYYWLDDVEGTGTEFYSFWEEHPEQIEDWKTKRVEEISLNLAVRSGPCFRPPLTCIERMSVR